MPLLENGKYVLSNIDGETYCKVNGAFKRHLGTLGLTEEEYLIKYELDEEPLCQCCGKRAQLVCGWKWENHCGDRKCKKTLRDTPEHLAKIRAAHSARAQALWKNPEIRARMMENQKLANSTIGEDGLTGYQRAKVNREKTNLERYGHAQYANWEKSSDTWANLSDEEKLKRSTEMSERQLAYSPEKKAGIREKVAATNIERYGVATPIQSCQRGYSMVGLSLFEQLDTGNGKYNPKSEEVYLPQDRIYIDFVLGNKAIEFHGDYWHCNPNKYQADYVHRKKNVIAKDIWERDAMRIKAIQNAGYEVRVVWESEYKKDPEQVVKELTEWLMNQ